MRLVSDPWNLSAPSSDPSQMSYCPFTILSFYKQLIISASNILEIQRIGIARSKRRIFGEIFFILLKN